MPVRYRAGSRSPNRSRSSRLPVTTRCASRPDATRRDAFLRAWIALPRQPSGGTLVEQFGLTEVFRTARMYTGGAAGNDTIRVFGVTSLELG